MRRFIGICCFCSYNMLNDNSIFVIGPSSYPMDIKATATSATSITITWLPLSINDRNGDILSYMIRYLQQEGLIDTKSILIDGSLTSFTLMNLRPYSSYSITIAATTSVGFGPESPVLTQTTFQAGKFRVIAITSFLSIIIPPIF